MSRYGIAENDFVALLQGASISGLNQVVAAGHPSKPNLTAPNNFVIAYTHTRLKQLVIGTVGSLKTIKTINFVGVLTVKAADIDNARAIAYPIIDAIRSKLDGHSVDYSASYGTTEGWEPTYCGDEDVVALVPTVYGFMIHFQFDMSFSKGVA